MSTDERTSEPLTSRFTPDQGTAKLYEIRVSGHLGTRWASWFDGMTIAHGDDDTSIICGSVVDQAALHGLLQKLRDLGINLISLTSLGPEAATEHPHDTHRQSQHHPSGAIS